MKKVTYRNRVFLDRFRCVDEEVTRTYDKHWTTGGLHYFQRGAYFIFTIANDDLIALWEDVTYAP